MFFRKLSIIFSISLLIFSSNIVTTFALSSAKPDELTKEIVKDLGIVDNEMLLLIKTISSKNVNKNELLNRVKYVNTLITALSKKTNFLSNDQKDLNLAINAILDFYQLSILRIESYLNNFSSEDLLDSIAYFSIGYYALDNIRDTIILEAVK